MSKLIYSSEPAFTDILNASLAQDKPVTPTLLKQLHHNALFAAVRHEAFDMGWFTDGLTVPTPVSLVDAHAYTLAETIFVPILGSSRQPATYASASILASPNGLARAANGLVSIALSGPPTGVTVVPGTFVVITGSTSVGGTNFNTYGPVVTVTDQQHFTIQQSSCLGLDTGGGGTLWAAFSPGQYTFPALNNSDVGTGDLLGSPYKLWIDPATRTLTCTILFASGAAGQGTVRVIALCERQRGTLTFVDGDPVFQDSINGVLIEKLLRGGSALTQTLARALSNNAKFAAVRMESFDAGYYADGDTIALPTSSTGYVYSKAECQFWPVLASFRSPSSHTPGQSTFPALSGSNAGSGTLTECPRQLSIDWQGGKIVCKMYFSGSGIVGQGTVHLFIIGQRSSVQMQG